MQLVRLELHIILSFNIQDRNVGLFLSFQRSTNLLNRVSLQPDSVHDSEPMSQFIIKFVESHSLSVNRSSGWFSGTRTIGFNILEHPCPLDSRLSGNLRKLTFTYGIINCTGGLVLLTSSQLYLRKMLLALPSLRVYPECDYERGIRNFESKSTLPMQRIRTPSVAQGVVFISLDAAK
jgi:hypothetical protein